MMFFDSARLFLLKSGISGKFKILIIIIINVFMHNDLFKKLTNVYLSCLHRP